MCQYINLNIDNKKNGNYQNVMVMFSGVEISINEKNLKESLSSLLINKNMQIEIGLYFRNKTNVLAFISYKKSITIRNNSRFEYFTLKNLNLIPVCVSPLNKNNLFKCFISELIESSIGVSQLHNIKK